MWQSRDGHVLWRAAICGCVLFACSTVMAQTPDRRADTPYLEVFSGADVTRNSVFGYFGAAWALGRDVRGSGARMKILAGRGGYDYDTALPGNARETTIDGDVTLFQLMAGYQWQRGPWTLKGYAGIAWEDHDLSPADPGNSVNGAEAAAIGQVEIWRNLGTRGFASLDASYLGAYDGYYLQGRLGRRIKPRVSAGLEAAALGNKEYDSGRGGAFLRFHLGELDLTVSGGVSGDYYDADPGGYGSIGLYTRF